MAKPDEDIVVRPCRMAPVDEQRHLENEAILHGLSLEYFNRWKKRWDILDLVVFLLLAVVYYSLLWTLLDVENALEINSSLKSVLPRDSRGNLLSSFPRSDKIYDWLNSSVVDSIWFEPVCGNGLCEPPSEVASGIFSDRGCALDCGNVTKIYIVVYLDGPSKNQCLGIDEISNVRDCPWVDLQLKWTALDESEWSIRNNAITPPSGKNGSINGAVEFFGEYIGGFMVVISYELNQGPNVKWYIDFPLIGHHVDIEVYFYDDTTDRFVKSLGFPTIYLNRLFVTPDESGNKTYLKYDRNFEAIYDDEDLSCVDSNDNPMYISDFPAKDLLCEGSRKSHMQVSIINPVSMYADYLSSPPRSLDANQKFSNRVLMGALITLTRKSTSTNACGSEGLKFNYSTSAYQPQTNEALGSSIKWCQLSGNDTALEFGSSPFYNKNSSFHNESLTNDSGGYINSIPFAFNDSMPEQNSGSPVFFILLDVVFDKNTTTRIVEYMKDGGFIDSLSDVLTLKILSYNDNFELYSLVTVEISFSDHGSVDVENEIQHLPANMRKISSVLLVLYWIFLSVLIVIELIEFAYYARYNKFLQFLWWNMLDIITYSLFLANGILWLIVRKRLKRFRPHPHYDVYKPELLKFIDVMLLSNGTTQNNGTLGYVEMFEQYEYFEGTLDLKNACITITCINSILLVIRLIKLCDFDSNFGIISRTISSIGLSMFNLTILWVVLSLGYAMAGILAFGDKMENFKDVNNALNTLGQIVMGDSSVNAMFDTVYPDYSRNLPAHIYFWSYVFIAYVILINFVIAVSCYSFENLHELTLKKDQMKNVKSQNESLFLLLNPKFIKSYYHLYRVLRSHLSKKSLPESFTEDFLPLKESQQESGGLEAFGSSNSVSSDPICDVKSLHIYGTEITHERIHSIMKSKLSEVLKVPDNRLEKEAYDLVHLIFCCYGVSKLKLEAKKIRERKREPNDESLSQYTSLKKELHEIRSMLSSIVDRETLDQTRKREPTNGLVYQSAAPREELSQIPSVLTPVPRRQSAMDYKGDC